MPGAPAGRPQLPMIRPHLPAFLLALPLAVGLAPAPGAGSPALPGARLGAPADKKLDAAAEKVRSALNGGGRGARQAALAELVALQDADAVAVLQTHFAKASQDLRGAEDDLVQKRFVKERKEEMLAAMRVRAERDPGLDAMVEQIENQVASLTAQIKDLEARVQVQAGLCEDLSNATSELFAGFGSGATKKAAAALWKDAEGAPSWGVRIAAVEMLGTVGGKGTTLKLHELMADVHRERASKKKQLPKLEQKLREFEARFQKEQNDNGGSHSRATEQQYNRMKQEPAALRREIHDMAFLVDAAAEAAGEALAREPEADLEKTLAKLVRLQGKSKGGLRTLTLEIFAHAEGEAVRSRVRAMLAEEEEPLQRAAMIDALAQLGDTGSEEALISRHLVDPESWHVRSRAIAALRTLRSKAAIPALIERLEKEEQGRLRTEASQALESLTGQRFGSNPKPWGAWWRDHGAGFEVPAEEPQQGGSLSAEEAVGVTFFGIRTESQRVLFVLDVSRSMNFAMVPRKNPNDDRSRPFDMPQEGEDSRLDVAKREMLKALGGIRDGGVVNIVMYATDVWDWADELVEIDTETRSELLRYVETIEANGGTNLFGGLRRAFDLAGVEEGDAWSEPLVDTIYLLSDGRASMGVTTVPDQILSYVAERNRTAGITLHTIGLSGAQDAYLLRSLAEQNGGIYVAQ